MGTHHVEIDEKPTGSKLDDDAKVCVVMREAPPKTRESLLVNYEQVDIVIQSYLNSNTGWAVVSFRNDALTESTDSGPGSVAIAHIREGTCEDKGHYKYESKCKA